MLGFKKKKKKEDRGDPIALGTDDIPSVNWIFKKAHLNIYYN